MVFNSLKGKIVSCFSNISTVSVLVVPSVGELQGQA